MGEGNGKESGLWSAWQPLTLASPPAALRFRLLKHTRLNVVAFLNELPKTQHDIHSFVVDISAQTVSTYFFLTSWNWGGAVQKHEGSGSGWSLHGNCAASLPEHVTVLLCQWSLQGR